MAAYYLFLNKGFSSTSIPEIAELAGTNIALPNYHFQSKKDRIPFLATPGINQTALANEQDFREMMEERKNLTPIWVNSMFNIK